MAQLVKIIPKCRRAKNRVKEHGQTMRLVKQGTFEGDSAILVESLNETFKICNEWVKWAGWFKSSEATFERVKDD